MPIPPTPKPMATVERKHEAGGTEVKVNVDFDICASTGTCAQIAPEVFEVRSDGYLYILQEEPPLALHPAVLEATEMCPTGAIWLEE
jgi:ferredoxin